MKSLNPNWFYSGLADAEYKRYILLAYLQDVQRYFNQTKLYPQLAELVLHYQNLINFKRKIEINEAGFPKELMEADLQHFKLKYKKLVENDAIMDCIIEIVEFSIPKIKQTLEEGKEIFDFVEQQINIEPVGILPIYKNEGYLLINYRPAKEWRVFEYSLKFYDTPENKFRAIHTTQVETYPISLVYNKENVKLELIRNRKKLPNPATFAAESNLSFPLEETILEISKRKLSSVLVE
ncbi:MAG: hypothetical protein ACOVO9_02870 [Bacteroidia bacterium]